MYSHLVPRLFVRLLSASLRVRMRGTATQPRCLAATSPDQVKSKQLLVFYRPWPPLCVCVCVYPSGGISC